MNGVRRVEDPLAAPQDVTIAMTAPMAESKPIAGRNLRRWR
jgi:hypothetical protein